MSGVAAWMGAYTVVSLAAFVVLCVFGYKLAKEAGIYSPVWIAGVLLLSGVMKAFYSWAELENVVRVAFEAYRGTDLTDFLVKLSIAKQFGGLVCKGCLAALVAIDLCRYALLKERETPMIEKVASWYPRAVTLGVVACVAAVVEFAAPLTVLVVRK